MIHIRNKDGVGSMKLAYSKKEVKDQETIQNKYHTWPKIPMGK